MKDLNGYLPENKKGRTPSHFLLPSLCVSLPTPPTFKQNKQINTDFKNHTIGYHLTSGKESTTKHTHTHVGNLEKNKPLYIEIKLVISRRVLKVFKKAEMHLQHDTVISLLGL